MSGPTAAAHRVDPPQQIIERLRELVRVQLAPAQAALFPALDAALFEAAKNSQSNNEQTLLLEGMTQLRREEQAILEVFAVEISQRFERYFGAAEPEPETAPNKPILRDSLSLIALDELEDDLAISILSTRRETEAHEQLWALNQRFAVLRSRQPGEERDIPFSPVALAKAFQAALRGRDLEDVIKTRLYQHFDDAVLGQNDDLLRAANALLAEAGLLPNLRGGGVASFIRSRGTGAADDSADKEPSAYQEPSANGEPSAQQEPSADREPSANKEPSEGKEPSAQQEPSAKGEPSASKKPPANEAPQTRQQPATETTPCAQDQQQQHDTGITAANDSAATSASAADQNTEATVHVATSPADWAPAQRQEQRRLDAVVRWQQQRVSSGAITTTQAGVALGELYDADAAPAEHLGSDDYREVLGDIQQLHKDYLHGDAPDVHAVADQQQAILGALQRYAHGKERRRVSGSHAQTIDLVGIIFSELLNNALLVDSVKALLSHLHTPYLKIALTDASFLSSATHPARLLLNDLAEAASRWINPERDTFKVYDKLYQLVHRLIDEYDNDLALIAALREDFANYCERIERRVQLAEKRNAQMQNGVDRLQAARDHSSKIVQRRIAARELPAAAAELLQGSWTEFLAFVFLRYGLGSQYWGRAVVMLNRAVVRVHAALLHGDTQALSNDSAIARLDARLQAEILDFGYAQQDAEAMLTLLRQASQLQLGPEWFKAQKGRGRGHEVAQEAGIVDAALQEDINLDFEHHELDDTLDAEERAIAEKLKDVEAGQWFEWLALNGDLERKLKLAWCNPATGRYMFVDQAGAKAETLGLDDLTQLVHRGRVRVANLDKKRFLERLLDGFISSLRQNS